MEKYAPKMMSWRRAISSPFGDDGDHRGTWLPGTGGLDYIHLDLTHLAPSGSTRPALIREVCMKFLGIDPITEAIPIRPVRTTPWAH